MAKKMRMPDDKAYVLLSGGQDSFVCALWAKDKFKALEAISIAYNQSHKIELDYAKKIAAHFSIEHTIYDIGDFFSHIASSSLLNDGNHNTRHLNAEHLPASFIPNRNGIFFTIAASHAFRKNEKHIHLVTGVCETDFSGYPDCRNDYIRAKAGELSLGLDCRVEIHTPLMWLKKAEIFELAHKAGKLKELNELTMTCYNGIEKLHEWGRGCGECPSCLLRKKGYEEYKRKT
jgi:7-cyano-7-deazaguanine synthase